MATKTAATPPKGIAPEDRSAMLRDAAALLRSAAAVAEGIRLKWGANNGDEQLRAFEQRAKSTAAGLVSIARELQPSAAIIKWNRGNAAAMADVRFTRHKERA